MIHKIITTLIATLLVTSIVGSVAGLAAAQGGQGAPAGMVGTPAENVGPPDRAQGGPPDHVELPSNVPTHAAAWSVHSSKHAADLETTVGAIDGQLALVFTDVENHAGRTVAVDAATLEDAVGERPEIAYVTHSSGTEYEVPVEYDSGHALLELKEFSSNTVTFHGKVRISGSPATDGAQYEYELAESADVSNYSIELTGSTAEAWSNVSGAASNGDSVGLDVGGNIAPTDGSGGDPALTISAKVGAWSVSAAEHSTSTDVSTNTDTPAGMAFGDGGNRLYFADQGDYVAQYALSTAYDTSTASHEATLDVSSDGGDGTIGPAGIAWKPDGTEFYVTDYYSANVNRYTVSTAWDVSTATFQSQTSTPNAGTPDGLDLDGDGDRMYLVDRDDDCVEQYALSTAYDPASMSHDKSFCPSEPGNVRAVKFNGTLERMVLTDAANVDVHEYELSTPGDVTTASHVATKDVATNNDRPSAVAFRPNGKAMALTDSMNNNVGQYALDGSLSGVSVSDDTGTSVSFGDVADGASQTEPIALSTSSTAMDFSESSGNAFDYELVMLERTETRDPEIEVNGNVTSYTGSLADGSTTSLSTDPAWLRDGTNRVNVSVGDGSAGSGPTPEVGLEYQHEAKEHFSTDYTGETWSERYNVTRSFADDRAAASLTIPFKSNRVIAIRTVEKRVDGGSWQTVSESERSLSGSELTVELGDVSAGQTISVRAVGSKVRTQDGEISVVEPTMLGDPLNTKISLDSMADGFAIEVNGTAGGELHYTHSESWSNPQAFARFRTDASQELRFPNAAEAEVARISTIDMGVNPQDGHADVRVIETGEEPVVQLRESSDTDRVELVWRETTTGHQYQLYSLDSEVERDTATASSPVTLISPGVAERLKIHDLGSASGGGDNPGVVGPTASRSFGANAAFIIGAAVAGLIVLFGATRRWGDGAVSSGALFGTGAVVIVLVVLQLLAPNVLADYLGRAIESAFPLVLLAGAAITIIWLRQRGDDTSIIIQGGEK